MMENRKRPGLICGLILFFILVAMGTIIEHIYRWPEEISAFVGGFGSVAYFMCMENIEVFFDKFFKK